MHEKPAEPRPTCTETAIQDSINAGNRLWEAQAEQKKTLQDIQEEEECNVPEVIENATIVELKKIFGTLNIGDAKGYHVDLALSAISEMLQIYLSSLEFDDEPRSWKEAKMSADAKCWEEGYMTN